MTKFFGIAITCAFITWISVHGGATTALSSAFDGDLHTRQLFQSAAQVDLLEACGVRSENQVRPCRGCPRERTERLCASLPCGSNGSNVGGDASFVHQALPDATLRPADAGQFAGFDSTPEPPPPRA